MPDIFVAVLYSAQGIRKYCHSLLVLAEDIRGLQTLLTLGVGWDGLAWLLARMYSNIMTICHWDVGSFVGATWDKALDLGD